MTNRTKSLRSFLPISRYSLCLCASVVSFFLILPSYALADTGHQVVPDAGKSYAIPYRLTDSGHILIRAKINGKGPFNFIVDTGAPLLFVAVPAAEKLGLKAKKKGFTTLETFQIEGGPAQERVQCVIETPFQLEGMNALGLPGVELHGIIGYTLLAHYKMEIDPTKDRMTWTKLDFTPPAPQSIGAKSAEVEGLDKLGGLMKMFAALLGIKGAPQPAVRGFFGMQLADKDDGVIVQAVLPGGPAAKIGLQAGDRIVAVQGKDLTGGMAKEAMSLLAKVTPGQQASFAVRLAGSDRKITVTITAGEGL
jgi:serine protease Do